MRLRVSALLYKDFLVATITNEVPIGILPHNATSTLVIDRLIQPDFFSQILCHQFAVSMQKQNNFIGQIVSHFRLPLYKVEPLLIYAAACLSPQGVSTSDIPAHLLRAACPVTFRHQ
jgi:hypothetical protein